jgi:hypothetical protein
MSDPRAQALVGRPLHHFGYTVSDIEKAAAVWSEVCDIGPFVLLKDIQWDSIEAEGESPVFKHSAAFAAWQSTFIELQEINEAAPTSLANRLTPFGANSLNHVAVPVENPEEVSEEIAALGYERYLTATVGAITIRWHDTIDVLGYSIEVHRKSAQFDALFERVSTEAAQWDRRSSLIEAQL